MREQLGGIPAFDAEGKFTEYSYDALGRMTQVSYPANGDSLVRPVYTYGYNALNQLTSVTDSSLPTGQTTCPRQSK